MFKIREEIPYWKTLICGAACALFFLGVWWYATRGENEERILSPLVLTSPSETLATFPSLWFDRALTRNFAASLWRVCLGFALAAVVGVSLGVLCGCFTRIEAFFLPMTLFGRNAPLAAVIPLTFALFGIGEAQKIMFIFIACVAFVMVDATQAIKDVGGHYVDTAYTLGASRWQVISKVLFPLALPSIFNSLRVLFGIAFGYIMLVESVQLEGEAGGLGQIINLSQRRGPKAHTILVLLLIPLIAYAIDRSLFWVQCQLFSHRNGRGGA